MISRKIQITGRVQGVFFRKFTQDIALALQLKGYVKNTNDGAVLIHCEGSEEQVNQLIQWCYRGSPMSKVEEVRVMETETISPEGFVILKT